MAPPIHIRNARPEDAPEILRIYGPYVRETAISFESEVPELSEMQRRMASYQQSHPWLVAHSGERMAGYAYGCPHRWRSAYQWSAEVSIYLDPEFQGRGLARSLYAMLLELLKAQGYRQALAGVTLPNEASCAFHAAMGFKEFAQFERVGYKFGKWRDTGWWRRYLLPEDRLDESAEELLPPFQEGHPVWKAALEVARSETGYPLT